MQQLQNVPFYTLLPAEVKPVLQVNTDQLVGIGQSLRVSLGESPVTTQQFGRLIRQEARHASRDILERATFLDDVNSYNAFLNGSQIVAPSEAIPGEPLELNWRANVPNEIYLRCHLNQSLGKVASAVDNWADGIVTCQALDESVPQIDTFFNNINGNFPENVVTSLDRISENPTLVDSKNLWEDLSGNQADLEPFSNWVENSLGNIPVEAQEPLLKIGASFTQLVEASELMNLILPYIT